MRGGTDELAHLARSVLGVGIETQMGDPRVRRGCGDALASIESTWPWSSSSQIDARNSARPPSPVPVSMIQSGRTRSTISWYAKRSVGAFGDRWPSHVVSRHARLCQNASTNAVFRSSGIGVGVVGCPSGPDA